MGSRFPTRSLMLGRRENVIDSITFQEVPKTSTSSQVDGPQPRQRAEDRRISHNQRLRDRDRQVIVIREILLQHAADTVST